eukprot:gnl/MRDRNA2_/MRDRNA2_57731_c0_seq1.p1 gnl/MRDRNA2_/MRDRNA2_57731_c0~~gnl/MRDRNA2_/MRDRNA2_57731_c0_seq1.p1  ORF type:complete len:828 (-),score=138.67 gnl/MRDRNA2_/MRDRNA2_57731_c0_seq1:40-2478(-)
MASSPKVMSGLVSPIGSASPRIASPNDTPRTKQRLPKKQSQNLTQSLSILVTEVKGPVTAGPQTGLHSVPEHHREPARSQRDISEQKAEAESQRGSRGQEKQTESKGQYGNSSSSSAAPDHNVASTFKQCAEKLEANWTVASKAWEDKTSIANKRLQNSLQSKLESAASCSARKEQTTIVANVGNEASSVLFEVERGQAAVSQSGALQQTDSWITELPSSHNVSISPGLDEGRAFRYMAALCTIDLSQQRIARLPDSFQSLWGLKVAILAHNVLESFVMPASWATAVELLDVSHNLLTSFPHVDDCERLHTLLLASNRIPEITCATIVPTLLELQLGSNVCSSLSGLHSFPRLIRLDVRNNNLPKISSLRSLSSFCSLRALALEGNPLASKDGCHVWISNFLPQVHIFDLTSGDRTARGYAKHGRRPAPLSLCTSEALIAAIEKMGSLFRLPEFLSQFSGGFQMLPKRLVPEPADADLTNYSIRPRVAPKNRGPHSLKTSKSVDSVHRGKSADSVHRGTDLLNSGSISAVDLCLSQDEQSDDAGNPNVLSETLRPENASSTRLLGMADTQADWLNSSPLAQDVSGAPSPSRRKQHGARRSPHSPSRAAHPPCERVLRHEWKSGMPELSTNSLRIRQQDILEEMWQQAGGKWPTDDDPSSVSQTIAWLPELTIQQHDDNVAHAFPGVGPHRSNEVHDSPRRSLAQSGTLLVEDCVREPQYFPPQPAPVDGTRRTLELAKEKLMLLEQNQRHSGAQEGNERHGEDDSHGGVDKPAGDGFNHELIKKLRRRRRRREGRRRSEELEEQDDPQALEA